ncbi:hypothetical protein [Persephonella sp. KM09-Lau-8]|uniref:hypothetical protein n=1 Tax=Persephonella sp. KM09-Lau-8 TaxID=1158345 RepID=UPI0004984F09|nr:hypothetical protein [Persephonella sp. KM09-Lau-8]
MTKVIIKSDGNKEFEISTKLPPDIIKQIIENLEKYKISEEELDSLFSIFKENKSIKELIHKSLSFDIITIGNRAVRKAQKESLEKGILNVYCKNGNFYFELPDGTITTEVPDIYKDVFEKFEKKTENKRKIQI